MPLYRFRILGKFGRFIGGQFTRWKDDDAARRHAAVLAAQAGGRTVEIWRGKQRVPPVRRQPTGPLATAAGQGATAVAKPITAQECRAEARRIRAAAARAFGQTRATMLEMAEMWGRLARDLEGRATLLPSQPSPKRDRR